MVPDRMARRRTRANEILPVHAARKHQPPGPGERHEATLADRARLSGPQTGARAWPLRRRGWRGFHHHATLCIAAYGFLISERGAIPPSGPSDAVLVEEHRLPAGYRPRGSPDQT